MAEDINDFEEARQLAHERYDLDVKGIFLNTLVSATSSITAGGLLGFVKSVSASELPMIVGVVFVAQVVPTLVVELNKAYTVNQAKKSGYEQGVIESENVDGTKSLAGKCIGVCEHVSYY